MYPSSCNNNSNFNHQAYFLNNEYPVNSEFSSFFDPPTMQNYDFEHFSRQFHHLFHEHDCLGTNQSTTTAAATTSVADVVNDDYCKDEEDEEERKIPKKRSSKKDRHSKINTVNGPRDRRMRLSLDVARKFFGLQDILGFDKASKTVDWLLNNSSSAIRELIQGPCTTSVSSTTTECEEVVSGVEHDKSTNTCDYKSSLDKPSSTKEAATSSKGKKSKTARPTVAKESRKKARERARARTSEKKSLVENEGRTLVTTNHHTTTTTTTSYEMLEARDDHYNWNSTAAVLNYNQPNSGEEPQFTDFLFGNKAWEGYNSFNLPG